MCFAAVSIPFIAGQWSLRGAVEAPSQRRREVSIPFIAGQWSLLEGCLTLVVTVVSCLNPLHCGAVVASWTTLQRSSARSGLNPLHCGAVVASGAAGSSGAGSRTSLNPLHCGAVVASSGGTTSTPDPARSQSPSLRGRGRFQRSSPPSREGGGVSIPFIAGQWSLHPRTTPFPFCRVLLRNTRPACDHVLCARLHVWPKPVIIP